MVKGGWYISYMCFVYAGSMCVCVWIDLSDAKEEVEDEEEEEEEEEEMLNNIHRWSPTSDDSPLAIFDIFSNFVHCFCHCCDSDSDHWAKNKDQDQAHTHYLHIILHVYPSGPLHKGAF